MATDAPEVGDCLVLRIRRGVGPRPSRRTKRCRLPSGRARRGDTSSRRGSRHPDTPIGLLRVRRAAGFVLPVATVFPAFILFLPVTNFQRSYPCRHKQRHIKEMKTRHAVLAPSEGLQAFLASRMASASGDRARSTGNVLSLYPVFLCVLRASVVNRLYFCKEHQWQILQ